MCLNTWLTNCTQLLAILTIALHDVITTTYRFNSEEVNCKSVAISNTSGQHSDHTQAIHAMALTEASIMSHVALCKLKPNDYSLQKAGHWKMTHHIKNCIRVVFNQDFIKISTSDIPAAHSLASKIIMSKTIARTPMARSLHINFVSRLLLNPVDYLNVHNHSSNLTSGWCMPFSTIF